MKYSQNDIWDIIGGLSWLESEERIKKLDEFSNEISTCSLEELIEILDFINSAHPVNIDLNPSGNMYDCMRVLNSRVIFAMKGMIKESEADNSETLGRSR